jgi:hypothetical protein
MTTAPEWRRDTTTGVWHAIAADDLTGTSYTARCGHTCRTAYRNGA